MNVGWGYLGIAAVWRHQLISQVDLSWFVSLLHFESSLHIAYCTDILAAYLFVQQTSNTLLQALNQRKSMAIPNIGLLLRLLLFLGRIVAADQLVVVIRHLVDNRRTMTYSSYKSRVSPLYKKLNLLKINDTYILEIGKFMHNLHWGRIPVNFDHLFTSVNQAHSHATRAATQGGYIWQLASTVKGKRFLKHLGPKIWDFIDPSLYVISPPAF